MIRFALALCALLSAPALAGEAPGDTVYLDLDDGRVVIQMRPDLAPKHVARVKQLIRSGYYDGLVFHRVIDRFAAQTGDIKGDGSGVGTGRIINAEFSRTPHVRGTVSMARTSKRNSADTEFFIVLDDNPDTRASLDGKYTVWGQVTAGMEFVDRIPKGDKNKDGRGIANPARIVKMQIAADVDAPKQDTAAILARADVPAAARDFSAAEFKCSGLVNGQGITTQSALAQVWVHGYLAGRYKASNALNFSPAGEIAPALDQACAAYPMAFLLIVASQELGKAPRDLPPNPPALPLQGATCKQFADARKASNKDPSELMGLWTFGYIQGYKNVSQPEMEIPYDARLRLLDAMAGACAKFPDRPLVDLASAVAAKVRIK
ncbi:MAG: peptidylprolyl isomerase [Rhodospirillaceae bacterium]